ncbi:MULTISPECIES: 2-succinyl-5-enolpyruvyl-6-hydroxy-3-cyclohexene-1-carboxylate synthase [unclassified Adlercreutzia]|uniref:2-succinyl-5-enolpyruvyl-6-hydroxy-3- cyclohexene-1-carboxylate synthase n=1 Tax=unclassified Adlercreutzia TaxID=2636013 RepID=UPI0013EA89BA|nr:MULTISPECIES: thiamine pyrophosphate-binding protein [unclassified Adlercreutzia]
MAKQEITHAQATALWVAAFFDELVRWGVRDVVVSPGSRSTALAMAAFELSRRAPERLRLYVDVDERGAAFFALGLAKASGRPAVVVCTSGTALANYYPAVMEAETSRVPLVVLSGDRPPQLQGLGAPQTTDQLKAYGDHVQVFRAMPLPSARERDLAFVRQAAREACLAALGGAAADERAVAGATASPCAAAPADTVGVRAVARAAEAGATTAGAGSADPQVASRGCARMAGPVHVNFPFDEPLKPDFPGADAVAGGDAFAVARRVPALRDVPSPLVAGRTVLDAEALERIGGLLRGRRALVLAGEGTCSTLSEAREVVAWAHALGLPLLADPLSGLRSVDALEVIDNYDNICRQADCPAPDAVIRFGRYPVSKHATIMAGKAALSVVVDVAQTRDFHFATDLLVSSSPLDFARNAWRQEPDAGQRAFCAEWVARNAAERDRIASVGAPGSAAPSVTSVSAIEPEPELPSVTAPVSAPVADALDQFEGAYVRALLELAPAGSCVFSANSMAVRAVDTFYTKGGKPLCVLCNRGQNGIDGTTSTALGAAQHFAQTTFVTGDFTLLHDLSALALQRELMVHHAPARSMVIVLLNNNGGAIFDMLPQASDEAYFERLFLVPQDVRFEDATRAFGVPYRRARTVGEFAEAYRGLLGTPGISLIEVRTPLRGVRERYGRFQGQGR